MIAIVGLLVFALGTFMALATWRESRRGECDRWAYLPGFGFFALIGLACVVGWLMGVR